MVFSKNSRFIEWFMNFYIYIFMLFGFPSNQIFLKVYFNVYT